MWKVVILASGLYIMEDGYVLQHYPMNVPHPGSPLCAQEKELSRWAFNRIVDTPLAEIPAMLQRENLGNYDPLHDWCAPRYTIRKTIPLVETSPAMMTPRPSAEPRDGFLMAGRIPTPPRRPRALPGT
jgi:hypothetical protein